MRFLFLITAIGWFALSFLSLASAAEPPANFSIQDVASEWFRTLFSMGMSGAFIIYLVYEKHVERKRKDRDNDRWQKMETVLLELVGNATKVIIEITASNKELRTSVEDLASEINRLVTVISTGSDFRRRATDHRSE